MESRATHLPTKSVLSGTSSPLTIHNVKNHVGGSAEGRSEGISREAKREVVWPQLRLRFLGLEFRVQGLGFVGDLGGEGRDLGMSGGLVVSGSRDFGIWEGWVVGVFGDLGISGFRDLGVWVFGFWDFGFGFFGFWF